MSDYSVSTTVGRACPTVGADWLAASVLPPPVDSDLCSCMYDTLTCVPVSDISDKLMTNTFSYLGGVDGVMDGVTGNSTSGQYGAYSVCNANQRLAWAMNQYFEKQGSSASACDFNGAATTKSATSATGSCSSQMKAAGTAGTGAVSGTLVAGATSGSGSGSAASSTSKGVAAGSVPQAVYVGAWQTGAYALVALATGVFMIML